MQKEPSERPGWTLVSRAVDAGTILQWLLSAGAIQAVLTLVGKLTNVYSSWLAAFEMGAFGTGGVLAIYAVVRQLRNDRLRSVSAKPATLATSETEAGTSEYSELLRQTRERYTTRIQELEAKLAGMTVISRDLIQMKSPGRLQQLAKQNAEMKHQLANLHEREALQARRESELAEWEKRLTEMKDEMEPIVRERNHYRESFGRDHQLLTFGRELCRFDPLDDLSIQVMGASVSELLPSLYGVMVEARIAWDTMTGDANMHGADSAVVELYSRVFHCEMSHAHAAVDGLKNCLERKHDPRPYLVLVYVCYREWRTWIIRLTLMTGGPALQLEGFAKWRDAETTFWAELNKKLAMPTLAAVVRELRAHDVHFGDPAKTPPMTTIPRALP